MKLKLKSLFYRYTGIYLASKEELEYVKSKEFWKKYLVNLEHWDDMSPRDVQSLMIGMWQCTHGFAGVMYRGKYKFIRPFYRFFTQLKWDIKGLFK